MANLITNWRHSNRRRVAFEELEDRRLMAVKIAFDYSLDHSGFFANAQARSALQYAGDMIGQQLSDSLAPIRPGNQVSWKASFLNPANGKSVSVRNRTIPRDTVVIYVAARRDLVGDGGLAVASSGSFTSRGGTDWKQYIQGRGNTGALLSPRTDFAPWGGSIAFERTLNWQFGKTSEGLDSSGQDFISVATHEIGHVLGFLTNNEAVNRFVAGGLFNGPKAKAANEGLRPGVSGGHFVEGVTSDGGKRPAMVPSYANGERKFFSKLDFAVLDDMGWEFDSVANDSIFQAKHLLTHFAGANVNVRQLPATIESAKDVDLYRIWADEGTTLAVTSSPTSVDTYLRLFDGSGKELANANQHAIGGEDSLSVAIDRGDYYYVGVSSFGNRDYSALAAESGPGGGTGAYTLKVEMQDSTATILAAFAAEEELPHSGGNTGANVPVYLPPSTAPLVVANSPAEEELDEL